MGDLPVTLLCLCPPFCNICYSTDRISQLESLLIGTHRVDTQNSKSHLSFLNQNQEIPESFSKTGFTKCACCHIAFYRSPQNFQVPQNFRVPGEFFFSHFVEVRIQVRRAMERRNFHP